MPGDSRKLSSIIDRLICSTCNELVVIENKIIQFKG